MSAEGSTALVSSKSSAASAYHRSDFAAQEALVEIVPQFTMAAIRGITGSFGPFQPNYPIRVPLWLALYLRNTNMCKVTPPAEMTVAFLSERVEREKAEPMFSPLPFHFFEIARQLLQYAGRDIPDVEEVHRLIDTLEEVRQKKKLAALNCLSPADFPPRALHLVNFTSSELEGLRVKLLASINSGRDLQELARAPVRAAPMQPPRDSAAAPSTTAGTPGADQRFTTAPTPSTGGTVAAPFAAGVGDTGAMPPPATRGPMTGDSPGTALVQAGQPATPMGQLLHGQQDTTPQQQQQGAGDGQQQQPPQQPTGPRRRRTLRQR